MKRFVCGCCSLDVPDDWAPAHPSGFEEPERSEGRLELQVGEEFLAVSVESAEYSARKKELLAGAHDEFKMVQEGRLPKIGFQDGSYLVFEYSSEEGLPRREMRVFRSQGPLAATLILLGPGGLDRRRDQIFEAIAQTFEIVGCEFLGQAQRMTLMGTHAGTPANPALIPEKFPRACVVLPVPRGWEIRREVSCIVIVPRSDCEIRLRRIVEHAGKPEIWFEKSLPELRSTPSSLILGFDQGEFPDGRRYSAILVDEGGRNRSWTTAASLRTLKIAVADQQPLEWSLRAPANLFQGVQADLNRLISERVFLDPEEWELRPAEPWAHLVLHGPWKVEAPGLYSRPDPFLLLQLGKQESPSALEDLRPQLLDNLRRSFKIQRTTTEQEALGQLYELDALRYSGRGRMAVHGIWVRSEADLYSCLLTGEDPQSTEKQFLSLVKALRLPGMRDAAQGPQNEERINWV